MRRVAKKATLYVVSTKQKPPAKSGFTRTFGERLQAAREDTIYERADIARACGVTKDTVRQWETGRAVTPAVYWVTICEMLYVDIWQLLTGRPRGPVSPMPIHLRRANKAETQAK